LVRLGGAGRGHVRPQPRRGAAGGRGYGEGACRHAWDPARARRPPPRAYRGQLYRARPFRASLSQPGGVRRPPAARARSGPLAASYQHAIVEALALRVKRALHQTGIDRLAIGGGVAANGPLCERLAALGATLDVPARELCTDNAAMIGSAARFVEPLPYPQYLGLDAYASGERLLAA